MVKFFVLLYWPGMKRSLMNEFKGIWQSWRLKNERGNFFISHWDLKHSPLELKASVLLMNYPWPLCNVMQVFLQGRVGFWIHFLKVSNYFVIFQNWQLVLTFARGSTNWLNYLKEKMAMKSNFNKNPIILFQMTASSAIYSTRKLKKTLFDFI